MTTGLDVLSVMDGAVMPLRDAGQHETARAMVEARATVSELLRACELVVQNAPLVATWLVANDPAAFKQVQDAINRAWGAA